MSARGVAGLACVLAAACGAPLATRPEAAYDPTALTGGLLYRWGSGTTVRVWVVPPPTAGSVDLALAVRLAISRWNSVRQFNEFTLTAAAHIGEAHIVVYDRESATPVSPGSCQFDPHGAAGYTYFCPGSGAPQRAERLRPSTGDADGVSVVVRVDRGRVSSQNAYNAIVGHEFGHALGIGAHSDVPGDLMFGLPSVETPSIRDRATLRFVLGQPPNIIL